VATSVATATSIAVTTDTLTQATRIFYGLLARQAVAGLN
jgi:hypothetical protein